VNVFNRWTRMAAGLAAAAAVAVPATASAAPVRTATATSYTNTTFLQHALGLPTADTTPAIESVTYDRFQWLLQQSGNLAFLIGDPAMDATFAARAQDVEAAAKDAGAKKVYWFDPNLSGSAKVAATTEPALDIRNSSSVPLAAASQTKYGNAWSWIVTQVGDGVDATVNQPNTESATVTVSKLGSGATTVNDSGGTQVGNASSGALYDYRTATPANVLDSFFFIYNKANTGQRIVSWTDLTTQATSSSTKADVTTAIGTVGAAALTQLDQFAWWKNEVNIKQVVQSGNVAQGANVPVITDADNSAAEGGWRVNQITYPELVDLLKNGNDANAVILFGGTWCPNTRPVVGFVNKYAQRNNVQVFNYDTVLDGGLAGGSTTAASDPLQSRNTANNGSTTKANPTYLYGDVVAQYLTNIKTEYNPATTPVTFYAGGGAAAATTSINKLQVPFVIGYQGKAGDAPNGGVTRQWIIDKGNSTYTEYMSQWWYTNPQPNQLGITTIPLGAPVWSTINSQLAGFTWQTDPTKLYTNSAVETDDANFLIGTDAATVTYNSGNQKWTIASSTSAGAIAINPTALSTALSALGASAPANLAAAKTALLAAQAAATPDQTQISNLTTVVGAWGIAQARKSTVNGAWGTVTNPGSVAGGIAAVHALDVFFGGLPGGVVSRRTVTADPVKAGTAPTISLTIANDYGRVPTGNVSLLVTKAGTNVASASAAVAQNAASFTLPALDAGTYDYSLSYPGDDQIAAFTETGSVTVTPVDTPVVVPTSTPAAVKQPATTTVPRTKASKVKGAVAKAPTSKKAGKYKVTITTPKGASTASGKVTIKLKKGKFTKTITGKLSHGVVTVSLPKLARGTWKVTISWPGDTHYLTASATGASIKVIK
jgi:hypothetical protein